MSIVWLYRWKFFYMTQNILYQFWWSLITRSFSTSLIFFFIHSKVVFTCKGPVTNSKSFYEKHLQTRMNTPSLLSGYTRLDSFLTVIRANSTTLGNAIRSLFVLSSLLRLLPFYGRCVFTLTTFFCATVSSSWCINSWRGDPVEFFIWSTHLVGERPLLCLPSTRPVASSF